MSALNKQDRVSVLKESAAYRRGLHPTTVPSIEELVMSIHAFADKSRVRQNNTIRGGGCDTPDRVKADTLNSIHHLLKLSQCEHELFATYKDELMGLLEVRMGSVYGSTNPALWGRQAQMAIETAVESVQHDDGTDRCIIPGFTKAINNIIYSSVAKRHDLDVSDLINIHEDETAEVAIEEQPMLHITPKMKVVSVTPVYSEESAAIPTPVETPIEENQMSNFKPTQTAAATSEAISETQTTTPPASAVEHPVSASPEVVMEALAGSTSSDTADGLQGVDPTVALGMTPLAKKVVIGAAVVTFAIGGYVLYRKLKSGNVPVGVVDAVVTKVSELFNK